jgi:tyrosine-protein phosphatase SIW14
MPGIIRRRVVATAFLALVSLAAGTSVSSCQSDQQPKGLPNFGRVAENLYRGGQPTSDGFNTLHSMGVGTVVNFRENRGETEKEKREVESLGMQYVGIPWSANDEPSNAQIVQFLDFVRAHPNTKMFVHCQRGADRTGVMIAAYRIAIEHKSAAEAISEMRQYHYDWFWLPHLKRYIESLPELLQKDPQFAAYRPQPSAVGR